MQEQKDVKPSYKVGKITINDEALQYLESIVEDKQNVTGEINHACQELLTKEYNTETVQVLLKLQNIVQKLM